MRDVNLWLLLLSFALGAGLTWLATVRRVTVEVPRGEPAWAEEPEAPQPLAPATSELVADAAPEPVADAAPEPVADAAPELEAPEEVYDVEADLDVVDDAPPEPPVDEPSTPAVDPVEAARVGALGAAGAGAAATLGIPDVEIYGPPAAMEPVDLPEADEELPAIRVQAPSWQGPLEDEPEPEAEPPVEEAAPEEIAAAADADTSEPADDDEEPPTGDTTPSRSWDEQMAAVRRRRAPGARPPHGVGRPFPGAEPDAGGDHLGP